MGDIEWWILTIVTAACPTKPSMVTREPAGFSIRIGREVRVLPDAAARDRGSILAMVSTMVPLRKQVPPAGALTELYADAARAFAHPLVRAKVVGLPRKSLGERMRDMMIGATEGLDGEPAYEAMFDLIRADALAQEQQFKDQRATVVAFAVDALRTMQDGRE